MVLWTSKEYVINGCGRKNSVKGNYMKEDEIKQNLNKISKKYLEKLEIYAEGDTESALDIAQTFLKIKEENSITMDEIVDVVKYLSK